MSNGIITKLASRITEKGLTPSINLERPTYVQPEDRIIYRATRIVLILGLLNTKNGLSKEVVACIDFLLRNPGYQKKFIIEYFKDDATALLKKVNKYTPASTIEMDFNIVQYKSVPWDLRFNDMFLFLHIRKLVKFIGQRPNLRVFLTDEGIMYFNMVADDFPDEINFLEIFGKRLNEEKARLIITEVIPNSYWRENEKLDYQPD